MFYPKTEANEKAPEWQRIMVPLASKQFVFDVIPGASYASVGVVYTCSGFPAKANGDIHLHNVAKCSGTFDRLSAWKCAEWRYV